MTWAPYKDDPMIVCIYMTLQDYENDNPCMRISVYEIIENAGRKAVMDHVRECDRSEWLVEWQKQKYEDFIENLSK